VSTGDLSGDAAGDIEIDVIIENAGWETLPDCEARVEQAARAALAGSGRHLGKDIGVAVLLADDATLRRLNAAFRHKDQPTNVLSFPAAPLNATPGHGARPSDGSPIAGPGLAYSGLAYHGALGDIALAYETCAREAEAEGKEIADHLAHLVVHGVLHLLGCDHGNDAEAEAMEAREIAILAGLGIADPYAGAEGGARE
jgi:probable rRNA maturation factor